MTTASRSEEPAPAGWVPDAQTFGARLALVRQRMGWGNVKEAAVACGISVDSWRNWERDGRQPRNIVSIVRQISSVTGANYYWLLDGSVPAQTSDPPAPRTAKSPRHLGAGGSRPTFVAGEGFEPSTSGL